MSPIIEYAPDAHTLVTFIGAITAFFAATVGLVQNDIKRVIAYSTCSQLGYMFVALGVGAYGGRDLPPVHPRLLQGAAVPWRRLGDPRRLHEQDMRNMGGLRKKIPMTYWMMIIGTIALTGVGIPRGVQGLLLR
jgi:NADH-quinone oxidoreductase subunit L